MSKVNTGSIWLGEDWDAAIRLSLKHPDCGVEPVFKDKYPDRLLDDEKVLAGYQIFGFGNNRKYKTRIPKSLNEFTKNLLEEGFKK